MVENGNGGVAVRLVLLFVRSFWIDFSQHTLFVTPKTPKSELYIMFDETNPPVNDFLHLQGLSLLLSLLSNTCFSGYTTSKASCIVPCSMHPELKAPVSHFRTPATYVERHSFGCLPSVSSVRRKSDTMADVRHMCMNLPMRQCYPKV